MAATSFLGIGVHTSEQNSHELGPRGMYGLMGERPKLWEAQIQEITGCSDKIHDGG